MSAFCRKGGRGTKTSCRVVGKRIRTNHNAARKQRLCNSADSKEKYSKWRIHIEYITKDSKKGVAIMIYSVNYKR